jgi:hypothetical protein
MPGSRDHWTGKTLHTVDRSQAMEDLEKARDELEERKPAFYPQPMFGRDIRNIFSQNKDVIPIVLSLKSDVNTVNTLWTVHRFSALM